MATHHIELQMEKARFRADQQVHVRVGDVGSQVVSAKLMDGDNPYSPPEGATAKLEILKRDNTWSISSATIKASGVVTAVIPAKGISTPGECKRAYFRIATSTGSAEATSEDFYLYIFPNATQDAIEASNFSDQFELLLDKSEKSLAPLVANSAAIISTVDEVVDARTAENYAEYRNLRDAITAQYVAAANSVELAAYTLQFGKYYKSNGELANSSDYAATTKIAVAEGETIAIRNLMSNNCCWFDMNEALISTFQNTPGAGEYKVPRNAAFIGVNFPVGTINECYVGRKLHEEMSDNTHDVEPIQWMDWSGYTENWSYLRHNRKQAVAIWMCDAGTEVSLLDDADYEYTLAVYALENQAGMIRNAAAYSFDGDAANFLQIKSRTTEDVVIEHEGYAVITLFYKGSETAIPSGYEEKLSLKSKFGRSSFEKMIDSSRIETTPLGGFVRWNTSATLKQNRAKTYPVEVSKNDSLINHSMCTQRMQVFSTMDAALSAYNSSGYVVGDVYSETAFTPNRVSVVPESGFLLLDLQTWSNSALPYNMVSREYLSVQHLRMGASEGGSDEEVSYRFVDAKDSQISNLKMHDTSLSGNTASDIVCLAHMSDPHASLSHVTLVKWLLDNSQFVDYAVCTGDQVASYFYNGFSFWGQDNPIPVVIGNHDSLSDNSTPRDWTNTVSQQDLYSTFFAPHLQATGVSMTANTTWWSKVVGRLRILGINSEMYDVKDSSAIAAQQTWFDGQLDAALSSNEAVLVCVHRTPQTGAISIWHDSNWSMPNATGATGLPAFPGYADIISSVDDFIEAGGVFSCYLCGHTHNDSIGDISIARNPQPFVVGNCAYAGSSVKSDVLRRSGSDSEYSLNLVSVNCANGEVRVLKLGADRPYEGYSRNFIRFIGKTIMEQN